MDFVTIDFETANNWRGSICAVGLVVYHNHEPVERFYSLVKPEDPFFDAINVSIHGITEELVKDAPEFPEVLSQINHFLENYPVIAHNASFDMSCLRHALSDYDRPHPNIEYGCTRILANRIMPGLFSYSLPIVAEEIGISPDDWQHHNALSDAEVCGQIFTHLVKKSRLTTFDELLKENKIRKGQLFSHSTDYKPCEKIYDDRAAFAGEPNPDADPTNPLYGQSVVFTGALTSMTREEAAKKVFEQGGFPQPGVNKKTNLLVVGSYQAHQLRDALTSSKLKKAYDLIQKGQELEIITETEFLDFLVQ